MMPSGWKEVKFGDLFSLTSGKTKPKNLTEIPDEANRSPVYGGNGIIGYSSEILTNNPNIIIGRVGEYCGTVRHVNSPCWITDNALYIRELKESVDVGFLAYKLQHFDLTKLRKKGGQPLVSQEPIYNAKSSIPADVNEQEKIAKILSTWDEAIEKLGILIRFKSDRYTYLRDLLTNHTTPQWSGVLNELAVGYNGLSGKSKNDFTNGNRRFITYNSVFRKPRIDFKMCELVTLDEGEKQNKVIYGDILFTGSSETPEEVGMSSVVLDRHDDIYLNSFCFGFRLNNFEILSPQFAQHYFRSKKIRNQIIKLGQGATRYNLSRDRMTQLKISLPSTSNQDKISKALDGLLQEIAILESILSAIGLQKRGLMQQLLTGKKRVKV